MAYDPRPIGVLDSGVGGLSVLRELRSQLPAENLLYFADQGHVPYGPRPRDEIRQFVYAITRWMMTQEVKTVVVACNTASAVALHALRDAFPALPFVGMEPAVKPAAEHTRSGVIAVLMTKATFQSELYNSLVDRFAAGLQVEGEICPDFVRLVEAGSVDDAEARAAVARHIGPLLDAGADQIVLGCTHFPFLRDAIEGFVDGKAAVVDPAPAVARQTGRIIAEMPNDPGHAGRVTFTTSDDADHFEGLIHKLLGPPLPGDRIEAVRWAGGEII